MKMICDSCMVHGCLPEDRKRAPVVPFHKKSRKNLIHNYRPTLLLPQSLPQSEFVALPLLWDTRDRSAI